MNTNRIHKLIALLLIIAAVAIVSPPAAEASGTASGVSIGNTATADYEVGGVPQTQVTSGPTATFVVDNKVNLTVTNTNVTYVTSAPSSTSQVQTFTVTNNGNTTQDYALTTSQTVTDPFSGADNFDVTGVAVYVESGATPGYQASQDTATYIESLASDSTTTVYIVADIPSGRVTNDIAAIGLIAATHVATGAGLGALVSETAGPNNNAVVDVVFADADGYPGTGDTARDGEGSARGAYRVTAAALTITKTAVVYSDPFNGTSNPKMIPGAIITYTITVNNAGGGSTASNVSITDSLNAEITALRLSFNTQFNDGVTTTCVAGEGIVVNGACKTNTNGDADGAIFNGNIVTVTGLTINSPGSAAIKFQVVVQ